MLCFSPSVFFCFESSAKRKTGFNEERSSCIMHTSERQLFSVKWKIQSVYTNCIYKLVLLLKL